MLTVNHIQSSLFIIRLSKILHSTFTTISHIFQHEHAAGKDTKSFCLTFGVDAERERLQTTKNLLNQNSDVTLLLLFQGDLGPVLHMWMNWMVIVGPDPGSVGSSTVTLNLVSWQQIHKLRPTQDGCLDGFVLFFHTCRTSGGLTEQEWRQRFTKRALVMEIIRHNFSNPETQ